MARSASAWFATAVVAMTLTGCVTTQQRNDRARLQATRLLQSRRVPLVGPPSKDVRVVRVSLIRSPRASAVVVELTSASARALSDVPIAVGVRSHGHAVYLNRRAGLDYFDTHVAAIGPRARATWVLVTRHRLGRTARGFAVVGAAATRPGNLPRVAVGALGPSARTLRVRVRNESAIPQETLPVYAVARRGGRYVAAGRASLGHVGTRDQATLRVRLIGRPAGASLVLQALPTIYA